MNDQETDCKGKTYIVQPRDTLYEIAQQYNVTVDSLIAANPQLEDPDQIFTGQIICIPTEDEEFAKEAVVLRPPEYRESPAQAGGVVLIQQLDEGNYALTFAAIGLPTPESIGDFDTYLGSVRIDGQVYSAVLEETAPLEQEPTWAGTRIIPENLVAWELAYPL